MFSKYFLDVYKSQELKPSQVPRHSCQSGNLTTQTWNKSWWQEGGGVFLDFSPWHLSATKQNWRDKKENQLKYEAKNDIKKIVLNSKTIMIYRGSKKTSKNKFEPKILAENTDNHVSSIVKDESVPVNKVVVASPAFVKSISARKLDSKTCDIWKGCI